MKRPVLQLVCVLCLLFSQQAAVSHAIWHANHQSAAQQGSHKNQSAEGRLCNLHGLFSQVVGAAPANDINFALADALNEQRAQAFHDVASVTPIRARSRGPPHLS